MRWLHQFPDTARPDAARQLTAEVNRQAGRPPVDPSSACGRGSRRTWTSRCGTTSAAIERAISVGEIDAAPIDQLTHVLLGAVTQAGLELGRSPNPRAARRQYGQVVDLLIDKLRVSQVDP